MLSPSVLNIVVVPRRLRICLLVRLIIPWRLPDWAYMTLPVPVILKRFFAPDFVFSLGIWLFVLTGSAGALRRKDPELLLEQNEPPRQPFRPGGSMRGGL